MFPSMVRRRKRIVCILLLPIVYVIIVLYQIGFSLLLSHNSDYSNPDKIQQQQQKSHHALFIFTPCPDPMLNSLITELQQQQQQYGQLVNDPAWFSIERELIKRGGGDLQEFNWKSPPSWLGYGYQKSQIDSKTREGFLNTSIELIQKKNEISKSWIYTSTFLPLISNEWFSAVRKTVQNNRITCILARRVSFQEQVFLAMDSMRMNRLSAKEYRDILNLVILTRIQKSCQKIGAEIRVYEFDKTKTWIQTSSFNYPKIQDPENSPELAALYQTATELDEDDVDIEKKSQYDDDWPDTFRRDHQAYLSIVTASKQSDKEGSDSKYVDGIIGLGRSLSFFDSSRERILLVTKSDLQDEEGLKFASIEGGWRIQMIDPINNDWFSSKCSFRPNRVHQKVRWGLMNSKIRAFEMYHLESALYLDLDICVTGKVNRLFSIIPKEYVSVSEGGIQHVYLNAGFLYLKPSKEVFNKLIEYKDTHSPPNIFNNLIDCTEMGWINAFFGIPDKFKEENKLLKVTQHSEQTNGKTATLPLDSLILSTGRPDIRREYTSEGLPLAVHFIRKDLCPKPWDIDCNSTVAEDGRLKISPTRFLKGRCDRFPYVAWCRFRYQNLIG